MKYLFLVLLLTGCFAKPGHFTTYFIEQNVDSQKYECVAKDIPHADLEQAISCPFFPEIAFWKTSENKVSAIFPSESMCQKTLDETLFMSLVNGKLMDPSKLLWVQIMPECVKRLTQLPKEDPKDMM